MARNPLTPFGRGSLFGGGFDPFLNLQREMNQMFDDVLRGGDLVARGEGQGQGGMANFINTNMNVSETDKEIRITAELPGVTDNDLDVTLEDDVLTIRGEKKFERTQGGEKENFHFVERTYGTFQRSLRLPSSVSPDQVNAKFENGVLTITLPKSEEPERTRKIQVQSAQSGSQEQAKTRKG